MSIRRLVIAATIAATAITTSAASTANAVAPTVKVAWVAAATPGAPGTLKVADMNTSTSTVANTTTVLGTLAVTDVALNPAGTRLAVAARTAQGDEIWLADVNGANATRIHQAAWASHPAWSGNGQRLVFASTAGTARPHPVVTDTTGAVLYDMTSVSPAYSPALSPDGRWVAYAAGVAGTDSSFPLTIADTLAVSAPSTVSSASLGGVLDVTWAPDGSSLAATSFTNSHYGVMFADPWGACGGEVLFTDQPTGVNNQLYYRFAGYLNATRMAAFMEGRAGTTPRLVTFTADPCGSFSQPLATTVATTAPTGMTAASVAPDASRAYTAIDPDFPDTAVSEMRHTNATIEVRASKPFRGGIGPMLLTYTDPSGKVVTISDGFASTGTTGTVVASTVYALTATLRYWDGTTAAVPATYRTPDATTLTQSINRITPGGWAGTTLALSGRLTTYGFGQPYAAIEIGFATSQSGPFESIGFATTAADGTWATEVNVTASGYVRAAYAGDDDRFASYATNVYNANAATTPGTPTGGGPAPDGSTPVTAPDAPTSVAVTAANRSLTVSWTPAATGFPATSYRVVTNQGGGSCEAIAPTTSCTLTGLKPWVAYQVSVVAVNAVAASAPATAVATKPVVAVKKKSSTALTKLIERPSKGKATWKAKGGCTVKGSRLVAPAKKATCTLSLVTARYKKTPASTRSIKITVG